MDELVLVLDRERHALERLLFRLLGARGALADEQSRFLAWAAEDLERAAAAVDEAAVRRDRWTTEGSLRGWVETACEPYATLLDEHRSKLAGLATDIETSLRAARRLAVSGRAETQLGSETLERAIALTGYDAVLTATDGVQMAGLLDFLA